MKKPILVQDEFLEVGDLLVSKNGKYSLVYQEDGNLEFMDKDNKILWDSGTKNTEAWRVYLEDNKLVIYRLAHSPIWSLEFEEGKNSLSLEDDGKLLIKDEQEPIRVIYDMSNLVSSKSLPMVRSSMGTPMVNKYPLDFKLKDKEGHNLLPINDETNNVIILEVSNRSEEMIRLKKLNSSVASENNFHFKLDFRSGTFKDRELELKDNRLINSDTWDFKINKNDENNLENIFSVYLLCKSDLKIYREEKLNFYFEKANALADQGTRKTRMLFTCNHIENSESSSVIKRYTKEKHLNIVYQIGERNLPINMGFLDTNKVVNDGKTSNTLKFHLKSVMDDNPFYLNTKASQAPLSLFILEFMMSDSQSKGEVKNRALAKKDMLNGISITIEKEDGTSSSSDKDTMNHWIIKKKEQNQVPFWEIYCSTDGKNIDKNGQIYFNEMVIVVNSIITDEPSGNTMMKLRYKNIPGYWDGVFLREIELTPMSIKDKRVGIGTNTPMTALEVKGTIKSTKIEDKYGELLPSGSIIMWYGDENSIPFGWKICNGEKDTPDLRDRFIVGAGRQYRDAEQGGQQEVTLTEAEMPRHQHQNHKVQGVGYQYPPVSERSLGNGSYTVGESQAHENRPPFYALYFIMKI